MTGPTSVGVVSAWFDPLDNNWSGVTTGLVSGLQSLGLFAGVLDGAAPHRSAVTLRHWLAASGRLDDRWLLTPEAVALHRVVNAARRRCRPAAGGWVHLGAFYGRPEAGPFVTFQDRTPVQ